MLSFPYYLLAEWFCLAVAFLYLDHPSKTFWGIIKVYLVVTVAVESCCYYLAWIASGVNNQWIYNLFIPVEYTFTFWIISRIISYKTAYQAAVLGVCLFYGMYLTEWSLNGTLALYLDKTSLLGSVIVILLSLLYFYRLFQDHEYTDLLKEPGFWFISGCFLFYTTNVSVDTYFDQLVRIRIRNSISLRYLIVNVLNIILYSSWMKAIICLKNKKAYMQPS